ncbi:hypothetical protein C1645_827512 [Glomus cerebriforme]|uniref:Uncharacterized protein n=1 Tax=Glomus cerebriforme TaxID=658196 RepID=A0A397SNQ5_9GLOM|nr:hypothetical protein C1645_827512 [Glomus cerebriforme]
MKTFTKLNGYKFIIIILEPNIGTSPGPRYQATCDLEHNEVIAEELLKDIPFQPFFIERLQINLIKEKRNQLLGISNWFEWSWPLTGNMLVVFKQETSQILVLGSIFPKRSGKTTIKNNRETKPNISIPKIPEILIYHLANETVQELLFYYNLG